MRKNFAVAAVAVCVWFICSAPSALAQEDADDIESLFSEEEQRSSSEPSLSERPEKPTEEMKELADLVNLAPFKDVAVIQKRFLPKTSRFEFFAGPTTIMNDAFFQSIGFSLRGGYYFTESYGFEFVSMLLSTTDRKITSDLRKRTIETKALLTPESYYGLDFKWTPIYGKMALRNTKIVPFDLYFSGGAGLTTTNQGDGEPTVHIGTGQTFAMSKSMAFRWDFSWNFFNSTSKVTGTSSMFNNIYLSVGMSFFFPEATYR